MVFQKEARHQTRLLFHNSEPHIVDKTMLIALHGMKLVVFYVDGCFSVYKDKNSTIDFGKYFLVRKIMLGCMYNQTVYILILFLGQKHLSRFLNVLVGNNGSNLATITIRKPLYCIIFKMEQFCASLIKNQFDDSFIRLLL